MGVNIRRTQALTAQVRQMFLDEFIALGQDPTPTGVINRIAIETGLTREQVRDSIFAESAAEWRHEMVAYLAKLGYVKRPPSR